MSLFAATRAALVSLFATMAFACTTVYAQTPTPVPPTTACDATSVGTAVAMQLDGDDVFVVGRDGVIARFEPKISFEKLQLPVKPPEFVCTDVADVVALAVGRGILRVANRARIYAFDAGSGKRISSFAPMLAPNETIAAIALLPSGALEVAIAAKHDATNADETVATRISAFAASARGDGAAPVRSFTYTALGRPSAITIDSKGRVYAYDDGGEILVFAAGATGSAKPLRRFAGTQSALRPVARGGAGGSRQMALDDLGSLYVADDGAIVVFGFSDDGQLAQGDVYEVDPDARLGFVQGIATGSRYPDLYILCFDPASGRTVIRVYPAYNVSPLFAIPVP